MTLFYNTQILMPLIGSKSSANVITYITLTDAYQTEVGQTVPTKTFDVGGMSRVDFAIAYTMGASETSNSFQLKVEWSPDGTNFYQLPNDSTSAGTSTITKREFTHVGVDASVSYVTIGIDISYKDLLRVSFKESGVATNAGTIFCEALVSGK